MGFISFHKTYYRDKLRQYESGELTSEQVYEAKQLLKLLDDLVAENYYYLDEELERDRIGATQLRQILQRHGEEPFESIVSPDHEGCFDTEPIHLEACLDDTMEKAGENGRSSDAPILDAVIGFSRWIEKDDETAYVFLLRDTLLPYIYFRAAGISNLYPWMIGRKLAEMLTGQSSIDSVVRKWIYNGLENGYSDFSEFKEYCCANIRREMEAYPQLTQELTELLRSIDAGKIVVVESGYCGTFPMLLAALDERVDFRMFTTAPFLQDIYGERIYTRQYEILRDVEMLQAQELLFELRSYENGRFLVAVNHSADTREEAYQEIRRMIVVAHNDQKTRQSRCC